MTDEPRHRNEQMPESEPRKASSQTKLAVEKVVGHKGNGRRRQYLVRWYGYKPEDDTVGPARKLIEHFIVTYNEQENSKQGSV